MLDVVWSNDLRKLAETMFRRLDTGAGLAAEDILRLQPVVVTPSRVMQDWAQNYFLYDYPRDGMKVLANIEWPQLYQFVNDWLYRMRGGSGKRDPAAHPFSTHALTWRVYEVLNSPRISESGFEPLRDYIDAGGASRSRRIYRLASRLAKLFDDYQVYRPELLAEWWRGSNREADGVDSVWQPELWRKLTAAREQETYLGAFVSMADELRACAISDECSAVHVFGVPMMPRVYLCFFELLAEQIDVFFYLFNPCREQWDNVLDSKTLARERERARLQGVVEAEVLPEYPNQLLANFGIGCRDFLGEVLDVTGGQLTDSFCEPRGSGILRAVQSGILDNLSELELDRAGGADESILVQVCHSPLREVEVLKDFLLRQFAEQPDLSPRDIQVLVTDMALYAPHIEAVFTNRNPMDERAIPYVIADRVCAGESDVAAVFKFLLALDRSRFTVRELLELLRCESVAKAFGMAEYDFDELVALARDSGIRWGIDKCHRQELTGEELPEYTTWRYGLDRLLAGYVFGSDDVGLDGLPVAHDMVEAHSADVLGRLTHFFDYLGAARDRLLSPKIPAEWVAAMKWLIESFFAGTDETYRDIAGLYAAAEKLMTATVAGDFAQKLSVEVVRDFVLAELDSANGGGKAKGDALVFCALRSGAVTPRRIVCLLGLGDGKFPRSDNRAAYDLLRGKRHRGDPSLKTEDRLAFLAGVMAAEQKLYLSYVGKSQKDDEAIPPSTVVAELLEHLDKAGVAAREIVTEHRLQPFHPAYFSDGGSEAKLYSYDQDNCLVARSMAAAGDGEADRTVAGDSESVSDADKVLTIGELAEFFVNPAKVYYRGLKSDIRVGESELPPDDEEFEPSGLTRYQVDSAIINEVMSGDGDEDDELYQKLLSAGMLPLGEPGRLWFEERRGRIESVIRGDVKCSKEEQRPLLSLLDACQPLAGNPFRVVADDVVISGEICGIVGDGNLRRIDFRYSDESARHLVRGWLRHLFAAAVLPDVCVETCMIFRNKDKLAVKAFKGVAVKEAGVMLGNLARIYQRGRERKTAFSPAAALAYAKQVCGGKGDEQKGLEEARKAWAGYRRGEVDDDSLRQAFGTRGPMHYNREEFRQLAREVFGPMIAALKTVTQRLKRQ